MQSNNAKDETQAQYQHDDRVDLESGRLVRVELCRGGRDSVSSTSKLTRNHTAPSSNTTIMSPKNPHALTTTALYKGSPILPPLPRISRKRPHPLPQHPPNSPPPHLPLLAPTLASHRTGHNILSMVELLPPAPAARVELGRVLAAFWARSCAARRRMAVLGPPGGFGELGRAVVRASAGEAGEAEWSEDDYGCLSVFLLSPYPPQSTPPHAEPLVVVVGQKGGRAT